MTAPVAVVTGAGRGIGRAIARRLHDDGYSLVVLDLDAEAAASTAHEVGGTWHACDVADADAVAAVADGVPRLRALVNNAGIWRQGSVLEASAQDLADVVAVNLLGTVNCCRAFVPAFDAGGAIVNVSSAAVATGYGAVGLYSATKGGIEVLTRQLSGELGPKGIRVNAVAPGLIVTEGTAGAYQGDRRQTRGARVPVRRVGEPEDIADVVGFLVSDQARYVSGQVIAVDGGLTATHPGA